MGEWTLATLNEHRQNVLFYPSEMFPLIPSIPIHTLPLHFKGFPVWGQLLTFPLGRKSPHPSKSFNVLQPKEGTTLKI